MELAPRNGHIVRTVDHIQVSIFVVVDFDVVNSNVRSALDMHAVARVLIDSASTLHYNVPDDDVIAYNV